MYKAIQEIGGYEIGEEVPAEKAEVWLEMYKYAPVELIKGEIIDKEIEEDKYTADDKFYKELIKINGIGPKTAKDIIVWGTKEKLIEQIKLNAEMPFRDDIVELLCQRYANE